MNKFVQINALNTLQMVYYVYYRQNYAPIILQLSLQRD